jgi:hypothetical protein
VADRPRLERIAEEPALESQAGAPRHLDGGDQEECLRRSTPSFDLAVKYEKAIECLIKDRDALLAFYDFPAE